MCGLKVMHSSKVIPKYLTLFLKIIAVSHICSGVKILLLKFFFWKNYQHCFPRVDRHSQLVKFKENMHVMVTGEFRACVSSAYKPNLALGNFGRSAM